MWALEKAPAPLEITVRGTASLACLDDPRRPWNGKGRPGVNTGDSDPDL